MSGFYNKSDPRFGAIGEQIRQVDALDLAGFDRGSLARNEFVRDVYYESSGVDRAGQSNAQAYHQAIQAAGIALNPRPQEVHIQIGDPSYRIRRHAVADLLNRFPTAFIHFKKISDVVSTTRLYIPCNLERATNFFRRLWTIGGMTKFKIVGYGDAVNRADVIVAWFQHDQHARAVGAFFDQNYAADMSGTYPVGAFRCSAANLCGWALEIGSSVGTDASHDLATGGDSRLRRREV